MNKIKLLFLLLISPIAVFSANDGVSWHNKSPIENVSTFLTSIKNNFAVESTLSISYNNFSIREAYYFNDYCTVSTTYSGDYVSAITFTNATENASYTATTQPAGSYADQTSTVIAQSIGLSFNISTNYVGGSNGVNVWIDFNDDGVFDADEKVFSATGATAHTGTITVPATVDVGEYRMRVRGQWGSTANPPACGEVSYGSTVDFTFEALEAPACIPVSALTATPTSLTSADLSWTSDGDLFDVEWGPTGFTLGDGTLIEAIEETEVTVTTVIDTPYQFYVRRNCGADGYSLWAGPFSFETGYCLPVYTTGCSGGAKISNFEITDAIINLANNTGTATCGANGYNDFTTMSASAPAEMVVSFTVGIGSYSAGVKIWVDWNGNGEFETDELMAASTATVSSGSSFTGNFTVPADTPLGDYRIRVRAVESTTNFTPCSSHSWGEAEDYTFTVIEEPACMPPSGLAATPTSLTSVDLSWTSDGDLFDVEWGPTGFTLGDGTLIEAIEETEVTVTTVIDTPYQFYVRRNCGADGFSLWAGPFSFETGYCTPTYTYGCSGGAKISNFEISDAIINLANNTGTGSCGANGYNDFTTMSASAPAGMVVSTTVGVGSYSAGVKIWIDWNGNGEFETDELMAASTATISSGSSFTGNFTVPADTPLGDYRVRVRVVESTTTFTPCSNQSYGEVEDYTFTVVEEPVCMPPSGLAATPTSLTSVDLSWTSDGDLFEVEWGPTGFTLGDGTLIEDIEETEVTVTTVIDTPYQFYVRRDCGADGFSLWAGPFSFETGYCTPTYTYGCSNGAKISNFEINDAIINLANNTGTTACGVNGYNDFTTMSASAPAGMVVSTTVGVGSYSAGVKIWIDWNGNGEFETDELMAASTATISSGSSFTGNFTVPADTPLGDYRVRVRVVESTTTFTPCSNQNYGEVEDYTFTVIEEPSCMPPSGLTVLEVTEESIQVGWTENPDQTTWEVIALPAGSPAPNATTTGFETTTENPYIIDGLDPSTEYDVYVRANCGEEDGISLWTSPVTTTTTQVPTLVDFEDDFEGDSGWTFVDGAGNNKWHIGNATAYAGNTSMYISDNNGTSNNYGNTTTITHAVRDLSFPATTNEALISFYWKAVGQAYSFGDNYDMLRVWLMPSSYQPLPNVAITAANGGVQIGEDFLEQNEWILFQEVFNLNAFAGNTGRLVFEWRNNGFTANQTPAAIDNVEVKIVTCSRPIDVVVEKHQVTNALVASWTPVSGETQWEVIVQDAADPAPDENTVGIIVNTPQYTIPNVVNGQFYKIYVRAICSEDDSSLWTDGVDFSDFNPPACANINMEFPDLNMDANGDFVHCAGELTLNLEAAFDDSMFKSTDSYIVEQIDYAPPFPFVGGQTIPLDIDDVWSDPVMLPFDVCFFGQNYNSANIGTNGIVKFGNQYSEGDFCAYSVPNTPLPTNSIHTNAIMLFHDIDMGYNKPISSVNFQVLGTYPCRALVANFNEIPYFAAPSSSYDQSTSTFQIVVYEITNIIEIYIQRKPDPYDFMSSPINNGRSVMGIQNADGTQAYFPPERNTGVWGAELEAWRFSPSGDTNVEFGWYMNGNLISNNPSHQITIDGANETFDFEARVSYPGCVGGEDLVLKKGFTVKISEELDLGTPADLIFCSNNMQDEDRPRITDNYETIMQNITQKDAFNVTYHLTDEDAQEGTNPIGDPYNYIPEDCPKTIFVRVESIETLCYETTSFIVNCGITPELRLEDVMICNIYQLPVLPPNQEYLYYEYTSYASGSTEVVENPTTTQTLEPGRYEVFVQATSVDGCYEIDSYFIDIFPCIIPKGISPNGDGDNDYLDLSNYMVQEITIYNRYGKQVYSRGSDYKREWVGQDNNGKALPTGTYYYNIITPFQRFTGYIYLTKEVK